MQSISTAAPIVQTKEKTDRKVLVGRGVSALVVLFMLFDGFGKVAVERHVVAAMAELGWPAGQTVTLGVVILVCTVLYAVPRTAVLGAILLTGFLGGATAAKARLEDASLLFSVAMGILTWLGLYLRDGRLRDLVPFRGGK